MRKTAAVALAAVLVLSFAGTAMAKAPGGGAGTSSGQPTLTLTVGVPGALAVASVGAPLNVAGTNYIPSAGGQQVILWVGYPNDYCSTDFTVCHGFYAYPWVNADGTFSISYNDVTLQSGTGTVSASQWNAKTGKWVTVASGTYTIP